MGKRALSDRRRLPEIQHTAFQAVAIFSILVSIQSCDRVTSPSLTDVPVGHSARWVDITETGSVDSPFRAGPSTTLVTTTILFNVPVTGIVTLTVFDSRGSAISILVNHQELEAGMYEVEFNAGDLASGVYPFSLRINSPESPGIPLYVSNRRMLLVK